MPTKIWEPTQEQIEEARRTFRRHYESLDGEEFLEHMVHVVAHLHAEITFLRKILHEDMGKGDKI